MTFPTLISVFIETDFPKNNNNKLPMPASNQLVKASLHPPPPPAPPPFPTLPFPHPARLKVEDKNAALFASDLSGSV